MTVREERLTKQTQSPRKTKHLTSEIEHQIKRHGKYLIDIGVLVQYVARQLQSMMLRK